MTYLDAAYHILHQAGHPLRYEDITERALAQQRISPQGLTPEATMASRLYTDALCSAFANSLREISRSPPSPLTSSTSRASSASL